MSSRQRREVWAGTRKKTSGGLTKSMLVKNKRGKLVSKKKSEQASSQNNLGSWLRAAGKKVAKSEMLRKKSEPPSKEKAGGTKAKVAPKPKPAPKPKAQKPKPAPKAAPKKVAPKKAAAPKPKPKPKRDPKAKAPKAKKKSNINPLTQQPYDPKAKHKVSIDNIKREKIRPALKKEKFFAPVLSGGW